LDNNHLPIVRLRNLTEKEYLRYYLLTKLFGTIINKDQFKQQFSSDIHKKLGIELFALKSAGAILEDKGILRVTPEGMYLVNAMMREFFASLNTLREICIEKQI